MKLVSTDAMKETLEDLIRSGRITLTAYDYAVSHGYSDADIIGEIERVRMARARLEIQGAPLRYKPEGKPTNPNDPTLEWSRKAGKSVVTDTVGKGEVVPVKRYRKRSPVEQHGDKLEMSLRCAFETFLQDSTYADRIRVADLNSAGGASGQRLGGLGNVPQHVRDRHARHEWIWRWLPPAMRRTARALVFGEMTKPDGTPFSMEDFGAAVFPTVQDRNRRWGIAAGALWSLGDQLVELYQRCPIRIRRSDDETTYVEKKSAPTHPWHTQVDDQ